MPSALSSILHIVCLVGLALGLIGSLAQFWPQYRKDLRDGLNAKSSAVTLPEGRTRIVDPIGSLDVSLPANFSLGVSGLGVVVHRDEGSYGALVSPIRLREPVTLPDLLDLVYKEWEGGLVGLGGHATLGPIRDEGAIARASLDLELGGDKLGGEARVARSGGDVRLEAYWCPKADFDRERAAVDTLPSVVRFGRPEPLPFRIGRRFACAVPEPFEMREGAAGLEVAARPYPRVAFGLTVGACRSGMDGPEQVIEEYLSRSRGLTRVCTSATRVYPRIYDDAGRSWDLSAREMTYEVCEDPVRAVLTAGVVSSGGSRTYLLAVRQSPPEEWDRRAPTLAAIEGSVRLLPSTPAGAGLELPLVHPDGAGELMEGWHFEIASRLNTKRKFGVTLLAFEEVQVPSSGLRLLMPLTDAQPDGSFLNPADPGELLGLAAR